MLRRLLLALMSCALVAVGVGSASSTTIAADFSITADQTDVGVVVGGQAVLAVDVSPVGSWLGPVSLSVSGAPAAAITTILPNPVLPGTPAVIAILAAANTPVGSYVLTITAVSGSVQHSIHVTLVVTLPTGFSMVLNPPSATVVDGASTDYTLTINRGLLTGPVSLSLSGLPQYATGTIKPSFSLLGSKATLHVATTTNVVPGVYRFTVHGSALLASATASAYLIVTPQTFPSFPISGDVTSPLAPGRSGSVNLAITNPFGSALTVTSLGVSVAGTSNAGCGVDNFAVSQYSGGYPLTVPANSTRTLQQLGVPAAAWPAVTMLDLPVNQDACKNATLSLAYTGSGQGN